LVELTGSVFKALTVTAGNPYQARFPLSSRVSLAAAGAALGGAVATIDAPSDMPTHRIVRHRALIRLERAVLLRLLRKWLAISWPMGSDIGH
jgi:hypothetical protein